LPIEALAKLRSASAPGHPPSLAEFGIMFVCSNLRQSLLRLAAAYTSGNLQKPAGFASGSIVTGPAKNRPGIARMWKNGLACA